jgi:hypothetical protein
MADPRLPPDLRTKRAARQYTDPDVTLEDAESLLSGLPLVPAMAGSLADMKRLRDRCLASDIPALVGCPPGAGKG